ncbi:MAG: histidine phosphatase family protein [Streptosporangiaceae bacterium]|nr:histidine phosphatase family protein [Streptosporangiaceae bacterium]MBV9853457.1 histidine phosphatase family protein [Streptosporangiaceae bacterium]
MSDTTIIHLLRHGEVENPSGIIYGRLPGYHLSANGRMMAAAAADFFAERPVVALFSSPLDRTVETAGPVAERLGLEIVTDERLVEPWNHFEGMIFGVGDGSLRHPRHWRRLVNPFLPSWGEPYSHVVARVAAVMERARLAAEGREAVCVSHQLPIWVTRRGAEGRHLWHNPRRRECALGSVTSFTYSGDRITGISYVVPARRQVREGDAAQ